MSVTYLNAAAVVGRLIGCYLADPLGAVNCFIAQLLGCAVLLFAWPSAASTPAFLAWIVIYGVFGGAGISGKPAHAPSRPAYVSGVPAGLGSISRHHMHELGQRAGLMFSFESISALIGARERTPSIADQCRSAHRRRDPRQRGLPRRVDMGRRLVPGGRSAGVAVADHLSAKIAQLARVDHTMHMYKCAVNGDPAA